MTQNDTSPANSFSLPSAGGVVSLLNDSKENFNNGGSSNGRSGEMSNDKAKDRKQMMSASSSTKSLNIPHLASHRSQSTSSDSSAPRSPFSSAQPSGGESYGSSSFTSVVPSTESSRDDSLESGKVSRASEESESDHQKQSHSRVQRTDTGFSSSPSEDEERGEHTIISHENAAGTKRRRDSNSKADEAVQARKLPMNRMLSSSRLARSPPPIRKEDSSIEVRQTENDDGRDSHSQALGKRNDREVPMNMHRATAVTQGGYGGKNELETNESNEVGSYHRRRSSTGESTTASSRTGAQVGRKGSSNSQIIGGKKRYPCSYPGCDKTFSTSGHAARHNRIHTGSKPYRCTFPGCNASFSRQDNSLQHYRTHVLHPKSRNGGTVNLDVSQVDAVALESELSNLDPETVATVQMGRKALEEGTAIAVVQEFIDGTGRRAEAVQRMVGQPKTGRRGSTTTQGSMSHQWDGDNRMSHGFNDDEHSHQRRMSFDAYDSATYSRDVHGQSGAHYPATYSSHHAPYPHQQEVVYPMSHPPSHLNGGYPVHPHAYPPHNKMSSHPLPEHYPGHGYSSHHGHPSGHPGGYRGGYEAHPIQERGPVSHPVDPRYFQSHETIGFGDRVRRESDNVSMHAPSYAAQQAQYHPSHSHHFNGQRPSNEPYFSPPLRDRRYSDYSKAEAAHNGHRRSASSASAIQPIHPYHTSNGYKRTSNEAFEAPSPSFSIHSFRSEGPYHSNQAKDGGANNALSLLSNAAAPLPPVRTDKVNLPSPNATKVSATSPGRSKMRKSMVNDMHLPLPKALSQVPCSSDRSTNGLTPTPLVNGDSAPMANSKGMMATPSQTARPFKSQAT